MGWVKSNTCCLLSFNVSLLKSSYPVASCLFAFCFVSQKYCPMYYVNKNIRILVHSNTDNHVTKVRTTALLCSEITDNVVTCNYRTKYIITGHPCCNM